MRTKDSVTNDETHAESKTAKLPTTVNGARTNFQVWWTRFSQTSKTGGEAKVPATEASVTGATAACGQERAAAVRRNAVSVASATMAFTSEAAISAVCKATSIDWPSGLGHLVFATLLKKRRAQDAIAGVELRKVRNQIKMKQKGKDPATSFEQTPSIENKHNAATKKTRPADDLIAAVLDAAPASRASVAAHEQTTLIRIDADC